MKLSARELLRRASIPYVENAPDGKYTTTCPQCGGPDLNVKIDKEAASWFCRDCECRSPEAQPGAGNGGAQPFESDPRVIPIRPAPAYMLPKFHARPEDVDQFVELCRADNGLPFARKALDWLTELRRRHRGEFECLLPRLQQVGVRTDELEQLLLDEPDVGLADFVAYMPMHKYIFKPDGETWPAASVNARIPPIPLVDASGQPVLDDKGKEKHLPASAWLDRNQPVEQITWAPGQPQLIADQLITQGGWRKRPGCTVFNLYIPPTLVPKAGNHKKWREHVRRVFSDDADHIERFLAHRVQKPQEKINHALVFGGEEGIGKDSALTPVRYAVGPWNFIDVNPQDVLGRFNGYVKSVILRVNEARDLGDFDRFAFHDHMKTYIAAPPEALRVNEKNLREYYVPNLCGVIITTNHKTDGIYLPADDRRHFVAWSPLKKEEFADDYWTDLHRYFADGGNAAVAAYLANLDLSAFDPKAPPPKTAAFWDIVDAHRAPEDAELADVLDRVSNPDAVTLKRVQAQAAGDFGVWLNDRKNRRQIPHRFEKCGYVPVRNAAATDGLWRINEERQVIYARAELSLRDRLAAASKLVNPENR
jgi:hypothetical protein